MSASNISSDTIVAIPVNPDFVRVIGDPIEPKAKSRAFVCIPIQTVLESKIGEWLEANVRNQKMSSSIAKGIVETIDQNPERLHPLNRGITILCNGFRYDSHARILNIMMRDPKKHGVIDGGHTYRAIEGVIKKRSDAGLEPPNAYVNLEIMSGYDEIAPDIISARNSVCQVRASAIYSLEGVFDQLRVELRKKNYEDLVAFKQNEPSEDKPITVDDVISKLTLFHPMYATDSSNPIRAYSSPAACVEMYAEEWRNLKELNNPEPWKNGYGKILHLAPAILELTDKIHATLSDVYNRCGGISGGGASSESEGTPRGRAGALKELSGKRKLPVTGKEIPQGWPSGYLLPMVSSLRAIIDYSGEYAKWRVTDPMAVYSVASADLMQTLLEFAEQFGRKPTTVGKNTLLWKNLYKAVSYAHLKQQQG